MEARLNVTDLCNYCHLHGAEKNGYCSDSCRRSMDLFRSAQAVIKMFSSEHSPPAVRRLAKAISILSNGPPDAPRT
jgi:hypothetical protein